MPRQTASAPSAVLAKLRFRHLQLLDVLGRTRNLRVAAEQLHVTQPAATKILSDIEDTLQARLFDRLPRDMRPTELGEFALRYASTALAELGKFMSELEALRAGGHGHLTVGAISASAAQVVTSAIRDILQQRPRLMVKLIEQSSDQLAIWLEDRRLDIMVGRLTEPRHRAIFDFEELSPEPVWVVCRPGHPLLAKSRLEFADVGAWPWILYPPLTAIRQLFDETVSAAGIQALVGMVETPSIFSTLELLGATDMLSLQPRAVVQRFVAEGMLARLPVPIRRNMSSYGIVTRKNELPSEAMRQFMAVLRAAALQNSDGV
nr:LysR substrate-binding domain-containing protein [uncultured Cupriavidus sp.]